MTPPSKLRVSRSTRQLANGTKVTTTKLVPRAVQEYEIQSAAVRALRKLPEFGTRFTLAADMAAGKRSRQASVIAKATGLVSGEPDLRVYLAGGRLCLIEFKAGKGRESGEQIDRIALLDTLGFTVAVLKAATIEEGAAKAVELVQGWLAEQFAAGEHGAGKPWLANDNDGRKVA